MKKNFVHWTVNYLLHPECISINWNPFIHKNLSFLSLKIIFLDRKSFPLTGIHFLWEDIISFDRKSFPFTGNHLLWQESFPLTRNHFLWQESILIDRKLFLLIVNLFLDRRSFPMERNHLFWQNLYILTMKQLIWQEIISFHRKSFVFISFACIYHEKGVTPAKYFAWVQGFRGNPVPRFPGNIPPWTACPCPLWIY